MKINKEDLILTAIIAAIFPFAIVYKIVTGMYNYLHHKITERKKMNEEIKILEKEPEKSESPKNNYVFDGYHYPYYSHNKNRSEYLKEFRKKKKEDYTMPNIIIAAEQAFSSVTLPSATIIHKPFSDYRL